MKKECRRCGICCRRGGPVLHHEDLSLVCPVERERKDGFGLADLMTLRKGEVVRDDIVGTLAPLETECVKIAPVSGASDWTCRFLDSVEGAAPGRDASCRIHPGRPAQCRALSCTDTEEIEALYIRERVSREDLLRAAEGPSVWLDLVHAHEESCSVVRMAELASHIPWGRNLCEEADELLRMIRFDAAFRNLCVEKGHIPQKYLLFLLGRPLYSLLPGYGLHLDGQSQGQGLVRIGSGVVQHR